MTDLKPALQQKLHEARAVMRSKVDGLGEYDLRRPMTPTGTNLLGLVKHLAGLEFGYLGSSLGRPATEPLAWMDDGSVWQGADMWATPQESSGYLIGLYERACAHADATIDALGLDSPAEVAHWPEHDRHTTLGFLLIRMVGETAQHAGHADILRELIDGQAGSERDPVTADEDARGSYLATIQAAADAFADR